MSKLKTPQDKKRLSLENDRRNAYGENAKSSRKNIPLSKRLSHKAERLAANRPLASLVNTVDEDQATVAELALRSNSRAKKLAGFRKRPDASLKAVLERKRTGKWPADR